MFDDLKKTLKRKKIENHKNKKKAINEEKNISKLFM